MDYSKVNEEFINRILENVGSNIDLTKVFGNIIDEYKIEVQKMHSISSRITIEPNIIKIDNGAIVCESSYFLQSFDPEHVKKLISAASANHDKNLVRIGSLVSKSCNINKNKVLEILPKFAKIDKNGKPKSEIAIQNAIYSVIGVIFSTISYENENLKIVDLVEVGRFGDSPACQIANSLID